MADLFDRGIAETVELVDADLRLWREIDLGAPPERVMSALLAETELHQNHVSLFGRTHPEPRLSAWYGDAGYRYSGSYRHPQPWTPTLLRLKLRVEELTGLAFNSVLLNYYRDGGDRMGMHSDDERELGEAPAIASLSLGATRELVLRHRMRRELPAQKLALSSGSLLLMQGETQRYWRHGVNSSKRIRDARLNLTFRRILTDVDNACIRTTKRI